MTQPSAQGIASLYRGNPQPLQQAIQKEQKAKPGLPPDLQKLLALQIVTNEKNDATAQQAMQQLQQMGGAQGNPPTVMQSLQEQAAQKMQAQAMQARQQQQGLQALAQRAPAGPVPEGTPQPEAQPEAQGIDQLPVEFAAAEGGIVAFANKGDVPEAEDSKKDLAEQAKSDRAALASLWEAIKGQSENAGRAIADVATLAPRGLAGAYDTAVVRPMRAAGVDAAYLSPKLTPEGASPESMTPFTDIARARASSAAAPKVAPVSSPDDQSAAETARLQRQTGLPQAAAPVARPPVPRPSPAVNAGAPGAGTAGRVAAAPAETMDPMEKAVRDYNMGILGRKDDEEYQKGVDRFQKTAGLDALYKELGDRATAREARNAEIQKKRTPAWVEGLASLSGAPVRGGLGMMLGRAGAGAGEARDKYQAEDIKFSNEVDALRDAITKAKMEGNLKAAAAGEQALKDLVASKHYAGTTAASLLNTQENARTRKQIAADAAASRAQVAQGRQDQLNAAAEDKKITNAERAFAADPEVKILTKRFEDPLFAQSAEGQQAMRTLRRIQADKYRQFGVATVEGTNKDTGFSSSPSNPVAGKLK